MAVRALADIDIEVDVSGPLFDGRAEDAVRKWLEATKEEIAQQSVDYLHTFTMDKTGRATGFFQDHVTYGHFAKYGDDLVVHAEYPAVVYAPWLEGVSERNRSTRFKGYHLFRITRQEMKQRADGIAERKLQEYLPQMGGA